MLLRSDRPITQKPITAYHTEEVHGVPRTTALVRLWVDFRLRRDLGNWNYEAPGHFTRLLLIDQYRNDQGHYVWV